VLCRCRCRQPAKRVPEAFCRPLRGLTTTATLPYGRGSDNDTTTRGCRETRNPKHETRRKQQTPNDNGDAPLRRAARTTTRRRAGAAKPEIRNTKPEGNSKHQTTTATLPYGRGSDNDTTTRRHAACGRRLASSTALT
jgi:hypothetical protein